MRIGNWKQSHTNRAIYPLDPRPEDVDIEDIAHALSQENRYGGHAPFPYPVAQHSVFVSQRVGQLARQAGRGPVMIRELALAGLLHDAHEAFLKDIPSPLKAHLRVVAYDAAGEVHTDGSYKELERLWDAAIARALNVVVPFEHPLVKQADAELLATEADRFFPVRPQTWSAMPAPLGIEITEWHWTTAKDRFLTLWKSLQEEA